MLIIKYWNNNLANIIAQDNYLPRYLILFGSWEIIIAINIIIQPVSSLLFNCSPKISQPPTAPKTASVLNIIEASVGGAFFCPII